LFESKILIFELSLNNAKIFRSKNVLVGKSPWKESFTFALLMLKVKQLMQSQTCRIKVGLYKVVFRVRFRALYKRL